MSLRLPPEEYAALYTAILKRDGYKCRHCKYRQNLHIHHIMFRSEQGPDESWNLVTLCSACHDAIHQSKLFIHGESADEVLIFERAKGWKPDG